VVSSRMARNRFLRLRLALLFCFILCVAFGARFLSTNHLGLHPSDVKGKPADRTDLRHTVGEAKPGAAQNPFSRIPVAFEQNRGQADPSVNFIARTGRFTAYVTPGEVVFALQKRFPSSAAFPRAQPNLRVSPGKTRCAYLKMRFVGGALPAKVQGEELLPWKTNYYFGSDSSSWLTGIANYQKVEYPEIYPGVNAMLHGDPQELELDILVQPKARPSAVKLQFEGASAIRVGRSGDLLLRTKDGVFQFKKPLLYQTVVGKTRSVRGRYALLPGHTIGFRVGSYDHSKPLVIDPVVAYSTYLAGNNDTQALATAVDSSGDAYVAGQTFATDFPTRGADQTSLSGTANAFLTKLNPSGTALVFSTYFGGNSFDQANGIAVDSQGSSYIVGAAGSSNFPRTSGAFLSPCASASTCAQTSFVAKFGPSGSLIYSSLTGGSNSLARALAVDANGDAYIVGTTASNDLPVANAFQPTFAGTLSTASSNAFVQKLDPTGSQLLYSTYLGGDGPNAANDGLGIAVDASGDAYVVGTTNSPNFPVKAPLQAGLAGIGVTNLFLTKFAPTGNSLVYSTYFGGSGGESFPALAVDGSGNAYITGTTTSVDFPLTQNAYRTSCSGLTNGLFCSTPQVFVLAVNPTDTGLLYSTYLGAGNSNAIAVDSSGDVSIAGSTSDTNFPVFNAVQAALQPPQPGINGDAFVATLNSSGTPIFSTYLGGTGTGDAATGIALDPAGNIYVAGQTSGTNAFPTDFPVVNPLQATVPCCSLPEAFVAKISPANTPVLSVSPVALSFTAVRNMSSVPLNITKIAATNGTFTGTCPTSGTLAPATGCWLTITAVNRALPTDLIITSDAPGSPQAFVFPPSNGPQGFGGVLVSAESLSFPAQLIGTSSNPQTVTLLNPTSVPVAIGSMNIFGGDFSLMNNCPATLLANSFCQASVTFTPSGSGQGGQLNFSPSGSAPVSIFLSGATSQNSIYIPAQTYQFGTQLVGAPPLPRTVTLTNATPSAMSVGTISVSGPFSEVNNCGSPLSPHGSCKVTISFIPISNGPLSGVLTVASAGTGGSQTVTLNGIGEISSTVAVSPLSMDFGTIFVGQPSNPQDLTLTNVSSAPVAISGYSFSDPQFSQTNNCPASPSALGAGSSCTVTLTFTPASSGPQTGAITITFSNGNPQIVPLQGAGTTPLTFVPTSLDFGNQQVGTTSGQLTLSVGNNSAKPITIQSIAVSGDFQQTGSTACPSSGGQLPGFSGCALAIVFAPTGSGTRSGAVTITASDSPTPHVASLTGVGVVGGPPMVSLSPSFLNFPMQIEGTNSQPQTITLTNTGSNALNINSVSASAQYAQTNNCPASLANASSCSISVVFTPTQTGSEAGTITITDDAAGSPQTVPLIGNATDFSLTINAGSNQAVVTAGQTATYNLQMTPDPGFSGTVTFSCAGAPLAAKCDVAPTSATLNSTAPVPVMVTVTTTARPAGSSAPFFSPVDQLLPQNPARGLAIEILLFFLVLAFIERGRCHRRLSLIPLVLLFTVLMAVAACGGGNGSTTSPPPPPGTPAGTSILVVQASSAGVSRSVQLSLTVN